MKIGVFLLSLLATFNLFASDCSEIAAKRAQLETLMVEYTDTMDGVYLQQAKSEFIMERNNCQTHMAQESKILWEKKGRMGQCFEAMGTIVKESKLNMEVSAEAVSAAWAKYHNLECIRLDVNDVVASFNQRNQLNACKQQQAKILFYQVEIRQIDSDMDKALDQFYAVDEAYQNCLAQ